MELNDRQAIMDLTRAWTGERSGDGRPRVADDDIETLRAMTLEEIWLPLYIKGYRFQFAGGMQILLPGLKLVGRAVTCTFVPTRPDLFSLVQDFGDERGWQGTCNQWVIDELTTGDVVVADMYDKIFNGTFIGGNLTTAIATKTGTGGAVIWGGVRDVEQMRKLSVQVYYRGTDPTPIRECVMTGYNTACRIGEAVCLPGDIVLGTTSGVLFIPSHMVSEVIESARKTQVKDIFGFAMLEQNVYTTAQIDQPVWTVEMLETMIRFIGEDQRCEQYRGLDWSLEFGAATGEPEALKEVLKTHLV